MHTLNLYDTLGLAHKGHPGSQRTPLAHKGHPGSRKDTLVHKTVPNKPFKTFFVFYILMQTAGVLVWYAEDSDGPSSHEL